MPTGPYRTHTGECLRDTVIRMVSGYGVFLDGQGGRASPERAFRKGGVYRVCPHVAATLVGCGHAADASLRS